MEVMLLDDFKGLLQGSNSKLFGPATDQFMAPLVGTFSELRRLYVALTSITDELRVTSSCPVKEALLSCARKELEGFVKALANLDLELRGSSEPDAKWRINAWATDKLSSLTTLFALLETCHGRSGLALTSACYACVSTGDRRNHGIAVRCLQASFRPIIFSCANWLLFGSLGGSTDAGDTSGAAESRPVWWRRLPGQGGPAGVAVEPSAVPPGVPLELAYAIATTGASSRFLRHQCSDGAWMQSLAAAQLARHPWLQPEARATAEASAARLGQGTEQVSLEDVIGLSRLAQLVHDVRPLVDGRLRHQLCVVHRLPAHLGALRRYALFGQGDFATALLEALEATMGAAAHTTAAGAGLSAVSLAGTLETAIRSSNAACDDRSLTDRLALAMLPSAATKSAWEGLVLTYAVQAPLTSVLRPSSMDSYRHLFSFLWQLKRAEFVLTRLWSGHMTAYHGLTALGHAGLTRLLHTCHTVRGDMTHTVTALTAFCQCDVLEPSFGQLEAEVARARGLPDLVRAHDAFLRRVLRGCMLEASSTSITGTIERLVSSVLRFCELQDELYGGAARTLPGPPPAHERGKRRQAASLRQPMSPREQDHLDDVIRPFEAQLAGAAALYQQQLAGLISSLHARTEARGEADSGSSLDDAGTLADSLCTRLNFNASG